MAHVTKFSRAASGHMFKHFERAKDDNGDYIKFSNQSIDPVRTSENYNLAPVRNISQGDYIRLRCADPDVHENKRKDLNVMCSWVVTLPQELPATEFRQFFDEAYKFMANRYGGEQNVISAFVHQDEVRPHMHFAFVPIVEDRQKGGYKVSAKDAVDRRDLQTFHADLDRHMEQVYGRNIGILNEATKEGNKSIEELKRGTAQKQLQTIWQERATATQEVRAAMQELQEVQKAVSSLQAQREALERQIEACMKMRGSVIPVKERKNLSGKVVEVTMTKEVYDACVSAQMRADHADLRAREAERDLQRVQKSAGFQENDRLSSELSSAWDKISRLRQQNMKDKEQLENIWAAFVRKPELLETLNETMKEIASEQPHHIGFER